MYISTACTVPVIPTSTSVYSTCHASQNACAQYLPYQPTRQCTVPVMPAKTPVHSTCHTNQYVSVQYLSCQPKRLCTVPVIPTNTSVYSTCHTNQYVSVQYNNLECIILASFHQQDFWILRFSLRKPNTNYIMVFAVSSVGKSKNKNWLN